MKGYFAHLRLHTFTHLHVTISKMRYVRGNNTLFSVSWGNFVSSLDKINQRIIYSPPAILTR